MSLTRFFRVVGLAVEEESFDGDEVASTFFPGDKASLSFDLTTGRSVHLLLLLTLVKSNLPQEQDRQRPSHSAPRIHHVHAHQFGSEPLSFSHPYPGSFRLWDPLPPFIIIVHLLHFFFDPPSHTPRSVPKSTPGGTTMYFSTPTVRLRH